MIILGETGTGKGMAAAAIGRSGFIPWDSRRGCFAESFTRAFISLNLSQFPEELLESELFGHKKGAFTGAIDNHKGIFGRCSNSQRRYDKAALLQKNCWPSIAGSSTRLWAHMMQLPKR